MIMIARLIIAGMLIAPIVVYIWKFGLQISNDHQRWAEMGSAMSGIYGPLIALLAFAVVIVQARMQGETNKHMYDHAYLQNARADIEFYVVRLADLLNEVAPNGQTLRHILLTTFAYIPAEQRSSEELLKVSRSLDSSAPQVQAMWVAIYSIFEGLRSNDESAYALQFSSAKQKAITLLSYPVCVALDGFMHCRSQGKLNFHYNFDKELQG